MAESLDELSLGNDESARQTRATGMCRSPVGGIRDEVGISRSPTLCCAAIGSTPDCVVVLGVQPPPGRVATSRDCGTTSAWFR